MTITGHSRHAIFAVRYGDANPAILVRGALRAEFSNSDRFYGKAGKIIHLPERLTDRPKREFLEWHLNEIFQT